MAKMANEKVGQNFGRPDLDRVGIFIEMSYMNGGGNKPRLEAASARLNVRAFPIPTPKWKTDLQDCYFDHEFKRIFQKEGYRDVFQADLREQLQSKKKQIASSPFKSTIVTKLSSTPGDNYGTFTDKMEAFSPLTRPVKKQGPEKRGFLGFYPKKGNCGYANITFDKYPEHLGDPYHAALDLYHKNYRQHMSKFKSGPFKGAVHPTPYFDENPYKSDTIKPTYKAIKEKQDKSGKFVVPGPGKQLGGNKSGCFNPYPAHSADKYFTEIEVFKELQKKFTRKGIHDSGNFRPVSNTKSWRIKSTIHYNMQMKVHAQNWKCARPFVQPMYCKPCKKQKPLVCVKQTH